MAPPRELFTDARVLEAPQQPAFEGKRLAQVPENSATGSVKFTHPAWFNSTLTARYVRQQYEDDLNTLPLGSYFVMDVFLSRAFGKHAEVYVAVENLFDRVFTIGRTSEGVISIGEARMARAGVRLRF